MSAPTGSLSHGLTLKRCFTSRLPPKIELVEGGCQACKVPYGYTLRTRFLINLKMTYGNTLRIRFMITVKVPYGYLFACTFFDDRESGVWLNVAYTFFDKRENDV